MAKIWIKSARCSTQMVSVHVDLGMSCLNGPLQKLHNKSITRRSELWLGSQLCTPYCFIRSVWDKDHCHHLIWVSDHRQMLWQKCSGDFLDDVCFTINTPHFPVPVRSGISMLRTCFCQRWSLVCLKVQLCGTRWWVLTRCELFGSKESCPVSEIA